MRNALHTRCAHKNYCMTSVSNIGISLYLWKKKKTFQKKSVSFKNTLGLKLVIILKTFSTALLG